MFLARIRSRHPSHRVLRGNPKLRFKQRVIIRLGSTTVSDRKGLLEINTVEAINNCSDKLKMKNLFRTAKVQSPKYWTMEEMAKESNPPLPLVKKIRFRSRGKGMVLVETKAQLDKLLKAHKGDKSVYFEQYFNGKKEYRLHISALGCFYTNRKVRKRDAKDKWYFNSTNCNWLLETNVGYDKPKTFTTIVKECQKALAALGLDFAAFDVRVKEDGSFVILEGNSAPAFGEGTAAHYLTHLPLLVKNKTK